MAKDVILILDYVFMAVLGLRCCLPVFSYCVEQGYSLVQCSTRDFPCGGFRFEERGL